MNEETEKPISFTEEALSKPFNISFKNKIKDFRERVKKRKFLSYEETIKECLDIQHKLTDSVDHEDSSDMDDYCNKLDEIQAYRDRIIEIHMKAISDYTFFKNYYESLSKIWINHSEAKSQDRREAEAEEIMYFTINARTNTEELFEITKQMIFNFNSKYNTVCEKLKARIHEFKIMDDGSHHTVNKSVFEKKKKEKQIEKSKKEDESSDKDQLEWSEI